MDKEDFIVTEEQFDLVTKPMLQEMLPFAQVELDNDYQIVIYTGITVKLGKEPSD